MVHRFAAHVLEAAAAWAEACDWKDQDVARDDF
jgi:hypothetical protein